MPHRRTTDPAFKRRSRGEELKRKLKSRPVCQGTAIHSNTLRDTTAPRVIKPRVRGLLRESRHSSLSDSNDIRHLSSLDARESREARVGLGYDIPLSQRKSFKLGLRQVSDPGISGLTGSSRVLRGSQQYM